MRLILRATSFEKIQKFHVLGIKSDINNSQNIGFIISWLDSGIRNRHNFFLWPIFLYQKIVADSVSRADAEDIKVFIRFPGNSILVENPEIPGIQPKNILKFNIH